MKEYVSVMKCYCPCATKRIGQEKDEERDHGPAKTDLLCSEFESFKRELSSEQVRILFPTPLDVEKKKAEEKNIPEDQLPEYLHEMSMKRLDAEIKKLPEL